MRLAITFAKNEKGKWHVLALPDVNASKQKELVKAIKSSGEYKADGKVHKAAAAYCLASTGAIRRYDRIRHSDQEAEEPEDNQEDNK